MTRRRPNWLLRGFIVLSAGIHVLIFLHMAGIYKSSAVSYIELSMHQLDKPQVRKLPVPRIRRTETIPAEAEPVTAALPRPVPRFKMDPVKIDPLVPSPEPVALPEPPDRFRTAGLAVPSKLVLPPKPTAPVAAAAAPADTGEQTGEQAGELMEFTDARDYLEMLNFRIQRAKKYPSAARSRHLEGKVKIQFILSGDGSLSGIRVIKSSRHKSLDHAALEAIEKASPFPRPPPYIFKTPVTLQVSISFELA